MNYNQPSLSVEGVLAPTTQNTPDVSTENLRKPFEIQNTQSSIWGENSISLEESNALITEYEQEQVAYLREEMLAPFIPFVQTKDEGLTDESTEKIQSENHADWVKYNMMWEVMRANNNNIPSPLFIDEIEFYPISSAESKAYYVGFSNNRIELLSFDEEGSDVRLPITEETLKLII